MNTRLTAFRAPVALFVYNRPEHTLRVLEALRRNEGADQSKLFIFSDGPRPGASEDDTRRICRVRECIRSLSWCRETEIVEAPTNRGLARSIREGVGTVLGSHDRVIVLEDDLVTSPGFLRFMNDVLNLYEAEPRVMCVSGYLPQTSFQRFLPETFFLRHMSCWGWGTWRESWRRCRWDAEELLHDLRIHPGGIRAFDLHGMCPYSQQLVRNLQGELDSWAIFWTASIYLANGLTLFPRQSLVENIGTDGSGVNFTSDQSDTYRTTLADAIAVEAARVSTSGVGSWYLNSFHKYGRDSGPGVRIKRQLGVLKHRLTIWAKTHVH